MYSTPNTKPRIAYLSRAQSQSKSKNQANSNSVEKAKMILGEQTLGIYSHSNQANLDYLSAQIELKKKEKQRARKKLENQEKQRMAAAGETKQEGYSMDYSNTIVEIDASQEETQRSQEEAGQVKNQIEKELKIEELRVPSLDNQDLNNQPESESDQKTQHNPSFINFFDNYIDILQQQPFTAHSPTDFSRKSKEVERKLERELEQQQSPQRRMGNKSLKQSMNKGLKYSIEIPKSKVRHIQQRQFHEQYRQLQRKYQREVNHGPILISKLQDFRRIEQQQKDQILSLQQKIELATKQVEKLRRLKQKHIKNRDLIRSVLMNQEHNSSKSSARTAGGMGIGMGMRNGGRDDTDSLHYQYQTFKSSTHRQKK